MTWDVWRARPQWACLEPLCGARVWLVPLPDGPPGEEPALSEATLACLSPGEEERAGRFVQARHARWYRAAHAALNVLLAEALSCSPASLKIEADAQGKPRLNPPLLHFNLSHSGAWALVAMHREFELGVDIEVHAPSGDLDSLARSVFSPGEWQDWQALPPSQRVAALFDAWTRKEACIKALGTGLQTAPETVHVGVGRPDEGEWAPATGPSVRWMDLRLPAPQAHSACLAWLRS